MSKIMESFREKTEKTISVHVSDADLDLTERA